LPDYGGAINVGTVTLSVDRYADSIQEHSEGVALAAPKVFDRAVACCPGWNVSDVVQHMIETQWFWATIVQQRLGVPPEEGRPVNIARDDLIDRFLEGSRHLVDVLRAAKQSDPVWTWAPLQKDVAFVTRHQVQETAVHHWDIAHAAGDRLAIDADIASDAIAEFLTVSVSSWSDPADPPRAPLDGTLGLWCTDLKEGWTVHDGRTRGTVTFERGVDGATPTLSASSGDLLLWLYSRVEIDGDPRATVLGQRLHALSFTN
jgi:uncharacterized protein (TIGR03083 family)